MAPTLEIQNHRDEPFDHMLTEFVKPLPATKSATVPSWEPRPSLWKSTCHRRYHEVSKENNEYFLKHWNFPNKKAEQKFLDCDFAGYTCLQLSLARDDRIHFACRFFTVMFLIDDVLEVMSMAEGKAYYEKLFSIIRGDALPDRSIPVEYILYDVWEGMRACEKQLADQILEPTFILMRFQTDQNRSKFQALGPYLDYRKIDIAKDVISATMCFVMGIHLSAQELQALQPLEMNCAKHLTVINDIHSWEREVRAAQAIDSEGAEICSAVQVLGGEINLDAEATKRVLWAMIREWELVHTRLRGDLIVSPNGCRQAVDQYIKGVEHQISGNEEWCKTTLRYRNTS